MKWKERMGLALSGALICFTLVLIVDVHYRIRNGQLTAPGDYGIPTEPVGTSSVHPAQPTGTVGEGGGEVGRGPQHGVGGDTAENQYANSKLTNGARLVVRKEREGEEILVKHDKVQYVQPSNLSRITPAK